MPQLSPLHDLTTHQGAVYVEEEGWQMPAHFGDAMEEYQTALNGCVIFDRSHCGKTETVGPEAGRFLHNLCTNDVMKLEPGTGCAAYLTTGQAKIVACAVIYRPALPEGKESYHLDVGPGMGPKVAGHLGRYLISERLEIVDRTLEWAQVHVAGALARSVLGKAFGDFSALFDNRTETLGDVSCQIRRAEPLGLPGYDLLCPVADAQKLWSTVTAAGARPAGLETYHVLRIEAGTPQYGIDVDETNLPQEVGQIEQTVSFTKGCYIGQETVARIRTYGHVNRYLAGLTVAGDATVPHGAKVYRESQETGVVTSSALSSRLHKVLALAYLRRGHQQAGTTVEIETAGSRRSAEVSDLPFTVPPAP
jgi:folate-binding protein YgfZ